MTDEKFKSLFAERVNSQLQDGYFPVVYSTSGNVLFAKLRHRTNENVIKVYGYLANHQLDQFTNGRLKYTAIFP